MDSKAFFSEADPRILEAFSNLNRIGEAINQVDQEAMGDDCSILNLIVESAIKVIPGAAAVIYTYNSDQKRFDPASRVSAGERTGMIPDDSPRPNGIGSRALQNGRRVLSNEEKDIKINPAIQKAGAKVAACFPLMVSGLPLGALYVYLFEERPFSELESLMVENFVNLAAMAIYQSSRLASIQRDLARKDEELSHIRRTGLLISSRLKLEETLEAILQMALEVTNAEYGIFRLVDKNGQYLVTRAIAGAELPQPQVNLLEVNEHSVMGWVAAKHQPALVYDLKAEPWSAIYYPLDAEMQMRSELAVPLINSGGRVEGVLNLESPQVGAFSEQDSHLLQTLATQAVIAIQEVRLLDAIQEVAELLITHPGVEVLARLAELACDLLNASTAQIWLLDGEKLVLQAACGVPETERHLPLKSSLTGEAVIKRSTIITQDVREDGRFHRPDLAKQQNWTRALITPLMGSQADEPVGAFSVYCTSAEPGRFADSDWDKKVLTCLAKYALLAIQNMMNQEALRTAQEQHSVAETFAAIGDIAANLLHQLNNKVGTIPVRIQGIQYKCKQTLVDDPYLAGNLMEIERSANEAMTAVRENLSHLRPIHLSEMEVSGCVHKAIEQANLPDGVKVSVIGLEELPNVIAGERNLILVFANLLENASDAMKGKGRINIQGTIHNRMVEILVTDSGPGIAPDLQSRIFELNYSGRSQTRPGKLGFGLWWVKTVMARLGGSVTVESDGIHGTTFRLKLPIAEEKK